MTTTTCANYTILGHEFDLEKLNDIVKHGMKQGVSSFIYTADLVECFNEHEVKIWDYLDAEANELDEASGIQMVINSIDTTYNMDTLKSQAVWMYVELKAHDILMQSNHPEWV